MDALTIHDRPTLRAPVLVLAFYGWNDAAQSASGALRRLRRAAGGKAFAEIDPEPFFVFTEHRPLTRISEGLVRSITWPTMDFTAYQLPNAPRDLILGLGTEPDLKWKTFSRLILDLAATLGVQEIATIGALLAEISHTQPVPLTGSASDPARAEALDFPSSRYEGPTGIVGVLGDAARQAGMSQIGLWASVPQYVAGGRNPRATLALLQRLDEIYDLQLDLSDLEARARRYMEQVSAALQQNPKMQEYVRKLEAGDADSSPPGKAGGGESPLRSRDVLDEVDRLLSGDHDPSPEDDA